MFFYMLLFTKLKRFGIFYLFNYQNIKLSSTKTVKDGDYNDSVLMKYGHHSKPASLHTM